MRNENATVVVTVRCFASVRELFGTDSLEVRLPSGATVEQLRERLGAEQPDLLRLPLAYAVNQDYAKADRALEDGDEVAFIPPISGGAGARDLFRFHLTRESLDPRAMEEEVRTPADGAVVTFAGVTRDHNEGERVEGLRYEAYEEMATRLMVGIFEETLQRFPITRVRVSHRLGEVPVGEASVLVVVSAAHRAPAFDACRYLMDRLKGEVPIFKKELLVGKDGESRWVGELPGPERRP